jgi:hypothetical protein
LAPAPLASFSSPTVVGLPSVNLSPLCTGPRDSLSLSLSLSHTHTHTHTHTYIARKERTKALCPTQPRPSRGHRHGFRWALDVLVLPSTPTTASLWLSIPGHLGHGLEHKALRLRLGRQACALLLATRGDSVVRASHPSHCTARSREHDSNMLQLHPVDRQKSPPTGIQATVTLGQGQGTDVVARVRVSGPVAWHDA